MPTLKTTLIPLILLAGSLFAQSPQLCSNVNFDSKWSSPNREAVIPSGEINHKIYRVPSTSDGNFSYTMKSVPRTGGGFYSYYPWGESRTNLLTRNTVVYSGVENGVAKVDYCFEWQEKLSNFAPGVAMHYCPTCDDRKQYGWQMKVHSKRNLEIEKMHNPVVIVEGFDFAFGGKESEEMSFATLEKTFNTTYPVEGGSTPLSSGEKPLDQLVSEGFDVVFVRFMNPTEDIFGQGENLLGALKDISKFSFGKTPMYLVGPSMGGQVIRSALMRLYDLRQSNDPTVSGVNISGVTLFDSPTLGATIPSSVFFSIRKNSDFDAASFRLATNLYSTAAEQMLYENSIGNEWGRSATSKAFYQTLNSPEAIAKQTNNGKLEFIAIANGSGYGSGQGITPATKYFQAEYPILNIQKTWTYTKKLNVPRSGPVGWYVDLVEYVNDVSIPEYITLSQSLNIKQTMNLQLSTADRGNFPNNAYKWSLNGPFNVTDISSQLGGFELENAPGGYFPFFKITSAALSKLYTQGVTSTPNIVNASFIPTISAAGLIGCTFEPTINLVSPFDPALAAKSFFKRIYAPRFSQPHCALTPENTKWMLTEIRNAHSKWIGAKVSTLD